MRVLIVAASVLGILLSANAAKAERRVALVAGNGAYQNVTPLAKPPAAASSKADVAVLYANMSIPADPAIAKEEANQTAEDRIGLDKRLRRDIQLRLTGLGFDIKASGKFDEKTRAVIGRWQAARDYPATGFLNRLQYEALLAEVVATTQPTGSDDSSDHPNRGHRVGGGGRHHDGGGGPVGFIGGVVGGLFGRR